MTKIPANPVILVDGSSYLFRAYYALPPLTNSSGQPTGAIYGVLNMLKNLLKEYDPKHIAVLFDTKEPTFRHKQFEDYKANRTKMPDELAVQIAPLFEAIKAMGLPLLAIPGVEADDVIATLAKQASEQQLFTLISTGDKDLAQIVNDHVVLLNTMSDTLLDRAGVINKFKIPPEKIVDYLSLIGDTVDNIPGVYKVGPKTAIKWLETYGSLAGIVEHADEIKGKVGENLRDALDDLALFEELVTVKQDVELPCKLTELNLSAPDNNKLKQIYAELEFKRWLAQVSEDVPVATQNQPSHEVVFTKKQLIAWVDKLKQVEYFSFDTETTSLDTLKAELVGVSLSVPGGESCYIPVGHDYVGAPKQLSIETVLQALQPYFIDKKKVKIAHNLKYDLAVLDNYAFKVSPPWHDTLLESYVLDSVASRHDMDTLALRLLNHTTISYESVAGKGAKQISFEQVDIEQAAPYAAEDAEVTRRLHEAMWPDLVKREGQQFIYMELEMPLMPVLKQMERHGVLIDSEELAKQGEALAVEMAAIEEQAFSIAGDEFNMNSPKQLQGVLFEKLGLPIIEKTPTGQPSTAESVLQTLAHDYPLPKLILRYRSLSKLKSTYTDKLPTQINEKTRRVHTSYHQAVTATGRLSSSDPNLQNIPIRTEEGRKIRGAFVAPEGYQMLSADYSQIELRIMAHLSEDKNLVKAFQQGLDIHRATASEVFGVSLEEVTGDQRRNAKAINFGLIYGMSAFGLSRQLGIEREVAQEYMDFYFERFPGVQNFMQATRAKAKKQGFVETMFGRRLYLPEINAKQIPRQRAAERAAINAPMQGAQADIIKKAMIKIASWINKEAPEAHMIMQVHDELIFEVPTKMTEDFAEQIKTLMQNAAELQVPLLVETGIGKNWDEAH